MEQINVNVKGGGQKAEYYNLATVKQMLDTIIEQIDPEGSTSTVVEEPSSVTELTAKAGKIYLWTDAPSLLSIQLVAPDSDVKKAEYNFIFEASSDFILSITVDDVSEIGLHNDANIIEGYNRVHISYVDGLYHADILNYRY